MFDRTEVYRPMEVREQACSENLTLLCVSWKADVKLRLQIYLQKQVEGLYKLFSNYTNNSQVPEDQYSQ